MDSTDNEIWTELTKNIKPLKKEAHDTERPLPKFKITPKITANTVYSGDRLKNLVFGQDANIDAKTVRRFKNGEFKTEAELDLHGCTEDKAFDKVVNFVKTSYLRGKRCIHIITGKGLHAPDDFDFFAARGVLKDRVPQWLNLPEIRPLILIIDHPAPKDGGTGVIRILLRRKRN